MIILKNIKHRTHFLNIAAIGQEIHDEDLNEALLEGWEIVAYVPYVTDDSAYSGSPGSVYTKILVLLSKRF